ncbi:glycosyltransferase family 2 protein [Bacteroides hominis]|uniref:glycosyltransferase family 2 protein n=1 Tax=Bacteroides hominis TaxID=2763023 RepID=UPI003D6B2AC6
MDTFIQITDFILFLCFSLFTIYLGIPAVAASLKNAMRYPKTGKKHRFAILFPTDTPFFFSPDYPEELYKVFTYEDLTKTVGTLDEKDFDAVIILGKTTRIEPAFLNEINKAFDGGARAIQLHPITENRSTRKQYFQALNEEINHSFFRKGAIRLGVSSALCGTDMVLDLAWLKKNQKSRKSNLERRLVRQGIFVEYLETVKVYSNDIRIPQYKVRFSKALSALPEAMLTAHWDYCNKIFRWVLPSWRTGLTAIFFIAILLLCYNWTLSLKWWALLYVLIFIVCLAIPDYLVGQKTKK